MCGGGGDSDGLLISCCVDQPTSPVADAGKKTEQQRAPLATADPGAAHRTAKLTYMPRELVAEPRSIDLQVHSLLHAPSTLLALVLATTRAPQVKGGAGGEATESRCSGTIAGKTPTAEEEATCKACGPGRGTGPGGETGTGAPPKEPAAGERARARGGRALRRAPCRAPRKAPWRARRRARRRVRAPHGEHLTASTTARTTASTTARTTASTTTYCRDHHGEHGSEHEQSWRVVRRAPRRDE